MTRPLMEVRRCPTCGEEKRITDFRFQRGTGIRAEECKVCLTKHELSYYQRHREQLLAAQTLRRHHKLMAGEPKSAWSRSPESQRNKHLKRTYGITSEEYDRVFEAQGGVCAACHEVETSVDRWNKKPKRLSIDHDHKTGRVRGLLCSRCNAVLGHLQDSERKIVGLLVYLQNTGGAKPYLGGHGLEDASYAGDATRLPF